MNTTDRRVRRTQKSLGDALIALALEKDYDEITIQEITDRADIGYRTFFRHYADKDALLRDVLSLVREEMRALMSPPPLEDFLNPEIQSDDLQKSAIIFQHVQENSDLYRVLIFSHRGLVQPLKEFAIEEFSRNYAPVLETEVPFDLITNHIVSGMVTLLRWWLEHDMCYSAEDMGKYAFRLVIQPIRDLFLEGLTE